MKLDAEKLRAEADAHSARMQSPLWADDGGKRDDNWTARLSIGTQLPEPPSSDAGVANEQRIRSKLTGSRLSSRTIRLQDSSRMHERFPHTLWLQRNSFPVSMPSNRP